MPRPSRGWQRWRPLAKPQAEAAAPEEETAGGARPGLGRHRRRAAAPAMWPEAASAGAVRPLSLPAAPRAAALARCLTPAPLPSHMRLGAGRPGGRRCRSDPALEESPGSTGTRCRPTAGGQSGATRKAQGKCHRKQTAGARTPAGKGERVRQERTAPPERGRQGKPHREQGRIGADGERPLGASAQGCSRPSARVGRAKPAAMRAPEEWPPVPARARQNPAYRPPGTRFSAC